MKPIGVKIGNKCFMHMNEMSQSHENVGFSFHWAEKQKPLFHVGMVVANFVSSPITPLPITQ